MSHAPAIQENPGRTLSESSAYENGPSIWSSFSTWLLLLPLVYFAASGNPLALTVSGSDFTGPSAADTAKGRIELIGFWLIVLAVALPYYKYAIKGFVENRLVSLLLFYCCLSTLWSDNLADSFRRCMLLSLTFALGCYLVERYRPIEQMQIIAATAVVAIFGSYITIAVAPSLGFMANGEWKGIFEHKNGLGIATSFLISPLLFMEVRGVDKKAGRVILLALWALLVFKSQSRGAWVDAAALLIFAFVSMILRRFRAIDALSLAFLFAGGAVVTGILIVNNFAAFTYAIGKDPTISNRTQIWNAVMGSVMKRPIFGYGYGGFWNGIHGESMNVISSVGIFLSHAHNGFLNTLLQLGIIGLAILLLAFGFGIRNFITAVFSLQSPPAYWYGAIMLLTIVASLDESFLLQTNNMYTILLVASWIGLAKAARGEYSGDLSRI